MTTAPPAAEILTTDHPRRTLRAAVRAGAAPDPSAEAPPASPSGSSSLPVPSPVAPRQPPPHLPDPFHAGAPATSSGPFTGGSRAHGVRLLTTSPELAEAVEAVCIGAGAQLTVTGESAGAAASSAVVLVDAGWPGDGVPPGCVVVALAGAGDAWEVAARFRAAAVVVLPHAAAWLAELISHSGEARTAGATGRVYGVVGATGGVGASTVACWLAGHLAAGGADTALVDGDPLGAGLDLALGEETEDGLRWPELNQFSGAVAADQLWAAMPRVDALRYLSWDRRATHADTVPAAAVISALRSAAAVQVVDLSRWGLARQARWCDAVVVLAPRTVRGVLAAERAVTACGPVPAVTALAGLNVADVEPHVLAEATGVPCAAAVAFDPRVPQHLDDGSVLRRGRIPRHAKAVARIAEALETVS
ncbi:septum site-determining protein Ssd [Kocuria sp.]|uniref:septum site-determining protein Ssd n=1 Tax=Kocuria sp. TaxID=1871328 RepID=UPI0026DB447D|nr:septum site-determining protein Ssd [Kocuria sp.]MDO4918298.1 hypothetical protein [Kocuria sp.]